MQLEILNGKEVKKLVNQIKEQFGIQKLDLSYEFFKSSKDKIYLINKEIKEHNIKNYKINAMGLYFGKKEQGGFRPSIEASQILGPLATKACEEIKEVQEWLEGYDIKHETTAKGFVIVKYGHDFLGSGCAKEGKILNYLPKERRLAKKED